MSILSFSKFINKKQMAKNKIAICFFDMKKYGYTERHVFR